MAIQDGTYRVYNITSDGANLHYALAFRFKLQGGIIAPMEDPTGILRRYVGVGPLNPRQKAFLESILRGSYRHVVIEQPGVVYPAAYSEPL